VIYDKYFNVARLIFILTDRKDDWIIYCHNYVE